MHSLSEFHDLTRIFDLILRIHRYNEAIDSVSKTFRTHGSVMLVALLPHDAHKQAMQMFTARGLQQM